MVLHSPISLNKDKHFRFRAELGWGLDDFLTPELCAEEGRPFGSVGKTQASHGHDSVVPWNLSPDGHTSFITQYIIPLPLGMIASW